MEPGRKMPAVKKLHQESRNNSKPDFIVGHSCQAIALVVHAASSFFALSLATAIHEGVIFTNRDKRTLLDKLVALLASQEVLSIAYLIADRYYASAKMIIPLLKRGQHLISAMRSNAVAYLPAPIPRKRRRGRPKKYGRKISLKSLFTDEELFTSAPSPVYGERGINVLFRASQLHWRPAGRLVLFVSVNHPLRSHMTLLSTDLTLDPLDVFPNFSRPAQNPKSSRNSSPRISTLTGRRAGG